MVAALGIGLLVALGVVRLAEAEEGVREQLEPPEEALVFWDEARAAWQQGDLDQAERLLRESFTRHPTGRAACDLGQLLRGRGRTEEAADWLERCAGQPDSDDEERAQALDEARALRDRTGRLQLRGGESGAVVLIDDEPHGRAPLQAELSLRAGPHRLVVTSPGGATSSSTVEVLPAQLTTVELGELARPAAPRPRLVPRWAIWMMAGIALATATGAMVTWGLDYHYSEDGPEDQAELMRPVSAVLGSFAGVSLGVALVLVPFSLQPRPEVVARAAGWSRW